MTDADGAAAVVTEQQPSVVLPTPYFLFFIFWSLAAAAAAVAPGLSTSCPRDLEMSPKGLEEGAISLVFSSISSSSSSWQRRGKNKYRPGFSLLLRLFSASTPV
ncbi:unnamed protein product [Sphagnum jensenii]|uniref:Secreted protein n=1 Tax=Sphagnum jensenii TaxID=128206 RepID=A0ABP1BKU0_9BRYO